MGVRKFSKQALTAASVLLQSRGLRSGPVVATGGTITDASGYRTHTFTMSGGASQTFTVTSPGYVDYMVVGAGGGSVGDPSHGPGSGGGAMNYPPAMVWLDVGTYTITIGAKGTRGGLYGAGTNGGYSAISGVAIAHGGKASVADVPGPGGVLPIPGAAGVTGGNGTTFSGGVGADGPTHPRWGQFAGSGGAGHDAGGAGSLGGSGGGGRGATDSDGSNGNGAHATADTGSGGGGSSGHGNNGGNGADGVVKIGYHL